MTTPNTHRILGINRASDDERVEAARQSCDVCGALVAALHIARTGTARHDHHGEQ